MAEVLTPQKEESLQLPAAANFGVVEEEGPVIELGDRIRLSGGKYDGTTGRVIFRTQDELEALYTEHAGKYKNLKEALIEDIEALVAPMREKRNAITDADVKEVLQRGAERARERAHAKMMDVRTKIGIAL